MSSSAPGRGQTAVLWLFLTIMGMPALANEAARRDFFGPGDRAQKYQRAEQIFPTRMVHAGRRTWVLTAATQELPADFVYAWEGAEYSIEDFNRRTHSNALLVLKDGAIVPESWATGINGGCCPAGAMRPRACTVSSSM